MKSFTLCLLEDDPDYVIKLTEDLGSLTCKITHFQTGEAALAALQVERFDLCLFDLNLSGLSGLDVMQQLRALGCMPPVIFLTSMDTEDTVVRILSEGADDFIVKPHSPALLLARIRALLRRSQPQILDVPEQLGALTINYRLQKIFLEGEPATLTNMEKTIAFYLLNRRGQIVPRQELYSVCGLNDDAAVLSRRLDVHISRIRSKLSLSTANGWKLSSIYQRGYRLEYLE